MTKRYEFTGETEVCFGHILHRIRALVDIPAIGVAAIGVAAIGVAAGDPAVRAKMSEARKKALAERYSWCPADLRDELQFLVTKLGRKEAEQIIRERLAYRGDRRP